jgi:hypothetical protein
MKRNRIHYIILAIAIVFISCGETRSKKKFNEGVIEYSINVEGADKAKISSYSIPSKFIVKFRDNNTSNRIEGMSGSVNLSFIKNIDEQTFIVLVNLWNKKLYYQDSLIKKNLPETYPGMELLIIDKTDETIEYNGYNCKKAVAHFKDSSNLSFDILYTNDIDIANPNINTPFEPIDGVMLKFSVKLNKYLMNLTATTIKQEDIPMEEFELPEGYEKVTKRTIEDLVSLMQ